MPQERLAQQEEKKSIWNSRLFKISLLVFGAGVVLEAIRIAAAGKIF